MGPGLSIDSIRRAEGGVAVAYDTAMAICARLNLNADDYLLPEDETIVLIPISSDSRIITGDMIVRGGNYINGTPFAFEAAMTLRASSEGDIVTFECALYRERYVTKYPRDKKMDDYTPEEWAILPDRVCSRLRPESATSKVERRLRDLCRWK